MITFGSKIQRGGNYYEKVRHLHFGGSSNHFPFSFGRGLAKDVCVEDQFGNFYIFKAMKALTKPGQVAPLNGMILYSNGISSAPLHGTAYVRGDGSVDIGFYVHDILMGADWTVQLRGGRFDTASGFYQVEGSVPNAYTFTGTVDCKSITLP